MTRRFIDCVVHVFTPEHMLFYSDCLKIQLLAFQQSHNGTPTRVWICRLPADLDPRTAAVAERFEGEYGTLSICSHILPPERMFKRCIGRHEVACQIAADSVGVHWMDVDHIYTPGVAESLYGVFCAITAPPAFYPLTYNLCRDHATGDRLIAEWAESGPPAVPDPGLFVTENPIRAIGGQLFVRGDLLQYGYCYRKHRRPAVGAKRFHGFTDDVAYKNFLRQKGFGFTKYPIQGLYRLRHTRAGYRDQDWEETGHGSQTDDKAAGNLLVQ